MLNHIVDGSWQSANGPSALAVWPTGAIHASILKMKYRQWCNPAILVTQLKCSQCKSIIGPLTLIAFVAVRLTVHINDSGPQTAIEILSSLLADDTKLLIDVSTSGLSGSTPCNVKSHSCVRLVREFVCFSRSCGQWSNLELEVIKESGR
jgi:hypothetical protein